MMKLLLVEDDAAIARSMTEFLSGEGFAVRHVLHFAQRS